MEDIQEVPLIKKQSSNLKCPTPSHHSLLEYICLDPKCTNKRWICSECHNSSHSGHEVMHYNVFIQLCNNKTVQLKNLNSSVSEELKKSEIQQIENFNAIKEKFSNFINQIIEKQTCPFFLDLNQYANTLINPDIINTAIDTLAQSIETVLDPAEINNQLEIITQNLIYSDEQLGLKLQFGPGILTSKIVNEITNMTETINALDLKTREGFQEKINHIYALTSKKIEELSKKMDEVTEKTDFSNIKLQSQEFFLIENEEVIMIEMIPSSEKSNEGTLLALGLESGWIKIFNLENRNMVKKFYAHDLECIKLLFVKDNMTLFSSGLDKKLCSWKATDNFTFQTSLENTLILDICSIPDNKLLAVVGNNTLSLVQYNLIKLTSLDFEENLGRVSYINSMQTFSRLVCGDFNGNLYFVDIVGSGESLKKVYRNCKVHNGCIQSIHVYDKKDLIITTGFYDQRILFHNSSNFEIIKEFNLGLTINQIFYDPIDEILLLNSYSKELDLFNLQNEKLDFKFKSDKNMNHFVWVHSKKLLISSLKEGEKCFLVIKSFV